MLESVPLSCVLDLMAIDDRPDETVEQVVMAGQEAIRSHVCCGGCGGGWTAISGGDDENAAPRSPVFYRLCVRIFEPSGRIRRNH